MSPTPSRCLVLSFLLPAVSLASPVVFFSDLDSGPKSGGQDNKGVFVTVWGKDFGKAPGSVTIGGGGADRYPYWSDTKITFQLGRDANSGDIIVKTAAGEVSNGIPFLVRPGRIFFVSAGARGSGAGTFDDPWRSPASFYSKTRPGDTVYFRAGTYRDNYGGNWGGRNFALGEAKGGTAGNPVAFVGYPSEQAVFEAPGTSHGNFIFTDTTRTTASYVTVANLTFHGAQSCIGGGGFWRDEESGGTYIRIVGNTLSANYKGNTMTGLLTVQGDGWRIWGNEFKDSGTAPPINNNHALYVQVGADDVDIGWNYFHDLRMGHVIQVHTDVYYVYEDVRIHDNVLTARNPMDCRGINIGRASDGTYGSIYNNVLYNLGQGFSAIAIYSGDWKISHNTLYNIHGGHGGAIWLSDQGGTHSTQSAAIINNIVHSDGTSGYVGAQHGAGMDPVKLSHNLYYGAGKGPRLDRHAVNGDPLLVDPAHGNFRLAPASPAIDAGAPLPDPRLAHDADGHPRPRGKVADIGAHETTLAATGRDGKPR